ncbi:MAG: serine/threonine protein kinase [Planctomycetes bacterium]|nr:serine/threonine protein kinase [Planctomycetota bacterium]
MSESTSRNDILVDAVIKGEQGEYKIVRAVGAGGMGSVYEAETVENGRKVAIKFLHQELSGEDSSSQERFEREIRVLQDLKAFRGIVQIEDWGFHEDGRMFLVMEFVAAPTLDRIIDENPNGLSQIRAVQVVIEILSVLEPIHHRRFVHRDLKPHNICVYDEPLAIRLLDFGLSKPYMEGHGYERVTRRMQGKGSEIPGSPHYMAVEQFLRPKDVDLRTDLYAVGIILYELIAGIPPFRGIYLQDILRQHKENEPPRIEQTVDGGPISYRLWDVIEKSLAKNAESRYQSAAEFKEALFDVLNNLNKRRRPRKDLDGKYRILRKLGTGGNSEVFEVERREDGERLALKIAREGATDWDEETLMNEADRALAHDNIVRVHEFGAFEGRPALAMELMEGGSVEDVIQQSREGGIDESFFYRTMIDICRGLHHAHQKNIVHRDVKPGNMLRTRDGRTKVCDFGIAKRFEQQGDEVTGTKNTSLAKGTAQYISPEQCDLQGRVDLRADIYSLGVMMYELLAGRLPFIDGVLIMQHLQTDPPPLEVKGAFRNPDALCAIVEKAMKKRPDQRFQSMKELAQELVRVSKLEPQKKPHKPVPLQTVPEEMLQQMAQTVGLSGSGTGIFVQPDKKGGLLKVAIVAAVVVIAVVVGFMLSNSKKQTDPKQEELARLESMVTGEDWAGISGFTFDELPVGDDLRLKVGERIGGVVAGLLYDPVRDLAEAGDRIDRLGKVLDALEAVTPASAEVVKARAFCTATRDFIGAQNALGEGWFDWNADAAGKLEAAIVAMPESWSANRWSNFIRDERGRVEAHDTEVVVKAITDGNADWTAIDPRVDGLVAGGGEARRKVLEALRGWSAASVAATTDMAGLAALFANEGPLARASARADATRMWTGRESDLALARAIMRDGGQPVTRGAAVVLGLLGCLEDEAWTGKVAGWAQLAVDPALWPDEVARAGLVALPRPPFDGLARDVLEARMRAPEFAAFFAAKDRSLADAERAAFSAACASGRNAALSRLGLDWSQFDADVVDLWNQALRPFSRDPVDLWNSNYAKLVETIRGGGDLDATFDGLEELRGFLELEKADQFRRDVQGGAADALDRFKSDDQAIARLGLALRFRDLIGYDNLVNAARAEARKAAATRLLGNDYLQIDWRAGLDGQALNQAWLALDQDCIRMTLAAHPQLVALHKRGLRVQGGNCRLAWSGDDSGEIEIQAAPAAVIRSLGDGLGAFLEIELAFGAQDQELVTVTLPGPERGAYDIGSPMPSAPQWVGPDNGRLRLTITVEDEHLDPGLRQLGLGGLDLALDPNGGGEGRASYARNFGLADVDGLVLQDVRETIRDAFGNAAEIDIAAADLRQRFGALVDQLASIELRRVQDLALSGSDGNALDRLRGGVDQARAGFEKLKNASVGNPRAAADQALRTATGLARQWVVGIGKLDEGHKAAYAGYRRSLEQLAAVFGTDWQRDDLALAEAWGKAGRSDSSSSNANGNGGNQNSGGNNSNQSSYTRSDLNTLGLSWIYLSAGGDCWLASVEMSNEFARQYAPTFYGTVQNNVDTANGVGLPMAPITPNMAQALVSEMNANASLMSQLRDACKGPVEIDIPTEAEWLAAGAKETGGSNGLAFGKNPDAVALRINTRLAKKKLEREALDNLAAVDSAKFQANFFKYLSGNVSEIVRTQGGFGAKGGSILSYSQLETNGRVDARAKALNGTQNDEGLSGLRLVIRPKRR